MWLFYDFFAIVLVSKYGGGEIRYPLLKLQLYIIKNALSFDIPIDTRNFQSLNHPEGNLKGAVINTAWLSYCT